MLALRHHPHIGRGPRLGRPRRPRAAGESSAPEHVAPGRGGGMWEGLWERGLEVRVFSYGVLFLFPKSNQQAPFLGSLLEDALFEVCIGLLRI